RVSPGSSAACAKPSRLTTRIAARARRWNGTRGAGPPCGEPPQGFAPRRTHCVVAVARPSRATREERMIDRLEAIARRYHEIENEMARPEVAMDHEKVTRLAREQRTLRETVETYDAYRRARQEMESAHEMLRHEKDAEMQEYMRSEERRAAEQVAKLDEKLKVLLLPKDPNDDRDVVVDIQGAEGGDEAALFAADLSRMYTRWAEKKGWKVDVVDASPTG